MTPLGPALVRAELDRPHHGTTTCADCPWRVACTPDTWVAELLRHRKQTHDKERT